MIENKSVMRFGKAINIATGEAVPGVHQKMLLIINSES